MEIRGSEKAAHGLRTVRIMGFGYGAALVFYAVLVEVLAWVGINPPHFIANIDLIRAALLLLAVGVFFFTGYLRERMLAPDFSRLEQALVPGERLKRMIVASVVTYVLCDAVATFGLVLFFLGGGRQDFYLFVLLALFFLAVRFPRADQWHAWYAARGQLR